MTATNEPVSGTMVDLGRYREAALRQWPLILVVMIIGGCLGGLLLPSAKYESSAVVQVKNGLVDLATTGTTTGPNMSTEQQVARSASVIGQAVSSTPGDWSVTQFQAAGLVSSPPDSTTLTLTFTASSSSTAQQGAQAWADAYLRYRQIELEATLSDSQVQLSARVDELRQQFNAAQTRVDQATPGSIDRQRAQADSRLLTGQLRTAQSKLGSLDGLIIDSGDVIGKPIAPANPSGLTLPNAIVIGALAGLVLGIVLALVAERFRDKIRDARDVARATSAPIWGTIDPRAGAVEQAYDALGARLLLASRHSGLRTVLVTGVDKPALFAAAQLAQALQRLGYRAHLTDDIGALLSLGRSEESPTTMQPDWSDAFLIVGAPAILADPRTAVLSSEADATLLVTEIRDTKVSDIERAEELMGAAGRISGVILTFHGSPNKFSSEKMDAMLEQADPRDYPGTGSTSSDAGRGVRRADDVPANVSEANRP